MANRNPSVAPRFTSSKIMMDALELFLQGDPMAVDAAVYAKNLAGKLVSASSSAMILCTND